MDVNVRIMCTYTYIIQLTPLGAFQRPITSSTLANYMYSFPHYFPNIYFHPEKTHDFRQSVDELFPRAIRYSIQSSNPWPQWWEDVA